MVTGLWTSLLLCLAGVSVLAWLVALMHEKGIRPMRSLAALFQSRSMAGRFILGLLFVVFGIRASEKFGGGLRSSNLPAGDEWENMPPITSTNTTRTLEADDFRRGFVMYRIGTGEAFDFSAPSDATVCADWLDFGAAADWTYVAFTNWAFQVGTNEIDRLRLFSFGKVEPLPSATNRWFAPLVASLGVVPEMNWQLLGNGGETNSPYSILHSQFWHFVTPSNTLQLTWQNLLFNRLADTPVSVQMEMRQDGRFTYRYDLSRLNVETVSNILAGASFGGNEWTTNALPTNVTSLAFHPLCAEDAVNQDRDGDGLSLLDELFAFGTDPDLPDTDHDGLADAEELAAGTDSLDPHTLRPDVCDGYALAMGALAPLDVPEGSTNTVLEHLFYTGTTNGTIVLPQPSETHAVLSVRVSGYGTGELAVGDRVVPLFGPEPTRSVPEPSPYALSFHVPRGQDVPVFLCADGTLSVALDSSEFAFGEIPSAGGGTFTGFVNFPNTVATTPCIHDFNARDVYVHLPVGEGASRLACEWTGAPGVGVVNSPPRSATISGDFPPRQTRIISYELSHPKRLFGPTQYQQSVRFCPQLPDPDDGEEDEPWYEDGEGFASDGSEDGEGFENGPWGLCGCDGGCDEGCTCWCHDPDGYPGGGDPEGGEGEEDVCPDHEVPYSQCSHLHETAYTNAVQNLPALNRVLYLRDPPQWSEIHLDVPTEPHRCCPCPEHWQNYVSVAYKSRRLRLVDSYGVPFSKTGSSCTVRVAGVTPSSSVGDAHLAFVRNGESYLSYRYTVLGVAIRAEDGGSLSRYRTANPSFGLPVAVATNAWETPQLRLVTNVGLGTGNVRVELADATSGFALWRPNRSGGYRKLLDTSGAASQNMSMLGWRQLIAEAGLNGQAYLPVLVTSSSPGEVDVVLRYWANLGGKFVEDEVRQRVTSVPPPMMADIDRDGAIGADDVAAYLGGRVFRFWTNEDTDKGDYVGQSSDVAPNVSDYVVNGRLDLVNLFPVKLDLKPFIDAWPSATFRLRAGHNRLRFCGVDVSPAAAGSIQTNSVFTTGGDPLSSANLTPVTDAGVAIAPDAYLGNDNAPGVLAFEAANEVWDGNSPELLVDVNGATLFRFTLPLAIDRVRNMYSWIGARHLSGEADYRNTAYHRIWDDASLKSCVFLHGANVSGAGAQSWSDAVFKRLWLSGAKMEFYSVDWRSDIGGDANYHQNASNAFVVASQLVSTISAIPGDKVMIAHSLGNMVVSSMIQDYGLQVSKYIMCNSAVPAEAYDASPSLRVPQLVHPDWEEYPTNSWAANWHTLFANEPNDDRKLLGWPGRFANVSQYAVNFYSTGDEVLELLEDNDINILTGITSWYVQYSWHHQELFKGRGLFVGLGATDWSGWNIEENILGVNKISVAEALQMTDADFKTNTVFYCYPSSMNQPTIPLLVRGAHLTQGIPALTPATGTTSIGGDLMSGNMIDMNDSNGGISRINGWPVRSMYLNRWLHSDIKDVSYFFNFIVYEKIIEKGVLQ